MKRLATVFGMAFFGTMAVNSALAEEVKINGATTTINVVINPHKAEVEKATNTTLTVVGNATGKGLVDLAEGRCDASLTSEPLDIAVMAAKTAGKDIKADTYSSIRSPLRKLYLSSIRAIQFLNSPGNK